MRTINFSKLALAALAGAVLGHFLEAPVRAISAKVWGRMHPDHPDHPSNNKPAGTDEESEG